VHLATPHIAGYSIEAKLAATRCLAKALREHFGLQAAGKRVPAVSADSELITGKVITSTRDIDDLMLEILPLPEISEGFRNSVDYALEENVFDLARSQQVGRHEFSHYRIAAHNVPRSLHGLIEAIGFGLLS
jgi:erythronate-4-phosphate dehydrogenase